MTRAFVLSGGGSLGSVQVGMLLALAQEGIEPELVAGTSVGAINAAWVAGRPGLAGAQRAGRDLARGRARRRLPRRSGGRTARPAGSQRPPGVVGRPGRTAPAPPDLRAPGGCAGAAAGGGHRHRHRDRSGARPRRRGVGRAGQRRHPRGVPAGDHRRAHPDRRRGHEQHAPLPRVAAGASEVWVLPTGYPCDQQRAPRTALGMAMQAVSLMVQERLILDVAAYQDQVELHVLPPLCPLEVSPIDFSHTDELIDRSQHATRAWLGPGPRRRPDGVAGLPPARGRRGRWLGSRHG